MVGPEAAALIDEYGRLDEQLRAVAHLVTRHKQIEDEIKSWSRDLDPDAQPRYEGNKFAVTLGPAANQRKIPNLWAVYRAFGSIKAFIAACTMTLSSLEAHLGKDKAAKYIVESRTGPRRLKVAARLAVVDELAA